MNGLRHIVLIFAVLLSLSSSAQDRPYAKFDNNGDTIGLFNLSGKRSDCRDRRSMTGTARNLRFDEHNEDLEVSLVFDIGVSRRFVGFTIGRKAIPKADIENLLGRQNHLRATACLSGGRWVAEEITKEESSK